MSSEISRRLVKNTFYMYIRMALLMVISLYTSRIVLQNLGVDNFGIYNVIGSVVAIFASLRTLFASSTQRFLNYEMGLGNLDRLLVVFNMSLIINTILSVLFILFAESIGLWFIENEMNVDASKVNNVKVILHLSVLTAVVGIYTTSFDALIIAHERMDFYAYLSVFEGVIRLVAVALLKYVSYDKLIAYGVMLLSLSAMVLALNIIYCHDKFSECRLKLMNIWDKGLFKEMGTFAGWNFLGNTSYSLTQSGLNMLLNVFAGVVANAARGVAYQINNALNQLLTSISTVVNPICTQLFAGGQQDTMFALMYISSKIYFSIQLLCSFILAVFANEILELWLHEVPVYSVQFLRLVLLHSIVRSLHPPIDNLFKSVGNLKRYQIAEIIIQPLALIMSYFALNAGCEPYVLFISVTLFELINYFVIITIAKDIAHLPLKTYLLKVSLPIFLMTVLAVIGFYVCTVFFNVWYFKLTFAIVMECLLCVFIYIFVFTTTERQKIMSVLHV